ncbi:MAG: hypothetical protein JO127_05070 [Caulobacteraceae bacterium]|nr:hypothetical protein [Caulobacteraceae bacterium]
MSTFRVFQQRFGWAVRHGEGMSIPFRTRAEAVREANALCEALRLHGQATEVCLDEPPDPPDVTEITEAGRSLRHPTSDEAGFFQSVRL